MKALIQWRKEFGSRYEFNYFTGMLRRSVFPFRPLWYAGYITRCGDGEEIMQAIQATYQNGVFTPEQPLELPEGSQVTLWVVASGAEVRHLRPEDREFLDRLATERAEVFRRLAE